MLNALFRPVENWPKGKTSQYDRRNSRFRATYIKTLDDLERELNTISAKGIVIQGYWQRDQIRNDGWPRSHQNPSEPGVILTFQRGEQTISMPCDTFKDWQQNLRAIALTLHALRMVDQYGVSSGSEQYTGFAQIAAPSKQSQRDWAVKFISDVSCLTIAATLADVDGAYKTAARRLHPDQGGSHDEFVRLQEAVKILREAA